MQAEPLWEWEPLMITDYVFSAGPPTPPTTEKLPLDQESLQSEQT